MFRSGKRKRVLGGLTEHNRRLPHFQVDLPEAEGEPGNIFRAFSRHCEHQADQYGLEVTHSCPVVMRHRYKSCPAEMSLRWPRTLICASAESTLPPLVPILFDSRPHRMPVPHCSFRAASQSL